MAPRACRGCLTTEPNLYDLFKYELFELFGDVIGNPIFPSDDQPQHICGMCYTLLMKFKSFRSRCMLVQDLLDNLQLQGIKLTTQFIGNIDRQKCNLVYNLKQVVPQQPDMIIKEKKTNHSSQPQPQDLELNHTPEKPMSPQHNHDDYHLKYDDDEDLPNTDDANANIIQSPPLVDNPKPDPPKVISTFSKLDNPEALEAYKEKYKLDVVTLTKEEQIEELKQKIIRNCTIRVGRGGPCCLQCGKLFVQDSYLQKHIKECHDESTGTHQCDICSYRLPINKMPKHLLQHKFKITCKLCDFITNSSLVGINHAREHGLAPKKYKTCSHCDVLIETKLFSTHVLEKHPDKLLWCKCCGESLVCDKGVDVHMRKVHKDLLQHQCEECGVKFASAEALGRHKYMSCEEFNCVMCGERFQSEPTLKDHVIKEHCRYDYIKLAHCDGCGVKFFGNVSLERHLEENSCGSGVPCQDCGMSFPSSEFLEGHKVDFHTKLYRACESCDKAFDSASYRFHISRVHNLQLPPPPRRGEKPMRFSTTRKMWTVHGSIIKCNSANPPKPKSDATPDKICDVCGKTYSKYSELKMHYALHTGEKRFNCEYCEKGYMNKNRLREHIAVQHTGEKQHTCEICAKSFSMVAMLRRHMLVHSEFRRHVCQVCGKAFRTSTSVKSHIKGVHLNLPYRGQSKRDFIKFSNDNPNIFIADKNKALIDSEDQATNEEAITESTNGATQYTIQDDDEMASVVVTKTVNIRKRRKKHTDVTGNDNDTPRHDVNNETIDSNTIKKARKPRKKQLIEKTDDELKHFEDSQSFSGNNVINNVEGDMVYSTLSRPVPKFVNIKRKDTSAGNSMPPLDFNETEFKETNTRVLNEQISSSKQDDVDKQNREQFFKDSGDKPLYYLDPNKQVYRIDDQSRHQVSIDTGTYVQSTSNKIYLPQKRGGTKKSLILTNKGVARIG